MKFYAWLLMIYPREFRERFAAGMLAAFTEEHARAQARGRIAGLLFLAMTALHTVWFALMQRVPTTAAIGSFLSIGQTPSGRRFGHASRTCSTAHVPGPRHDSTSPTRGAPTRSAARM